MNEGRGVGRPHWKMLDEVKRRWKDERMCGPRWGGVEGTRNVKNDDNFVPFSGETIAKVRVSGDGFFWANGIFEKPLSYFRETASWNK